MTGAVSVIVANMNPAIVTLEVQAFDLGSQPQKSNWTSFVVLVIDYNDEIPIFISPTDGQIIYINEVHLCVCCVCMCVCMCCDGVIVCMCMCVHVFVNVCPCMHVCLWVSVVYVFVCVVFVCVCECVGVYVYVSFVEF